MKSFVLAKELKINIASEGFPYWAYTFDKIENMKSYEKIEMNSLYNEIAKKYEKTALAIERAMRYSIQNSKPFIQKYFNTEEKITNGNLVNLLIFYKFLENK